MVISSQIITIIIYLSFQWSQECQCACNVKSLHTKGFSQNGFNGTPSKPAICTHGTPPTVTDLFQIRNNRINKFMLTDTIEKKKKHTPHNSGFIQFLFCFTVAQWWEAASGITVQGIARGGRERTCMSPVMSHLTIERTIKSINCPKNSQMVLGVSN